MRIMLFLLLIIFSDNLIGQVLTIKGNNSIAICGVYQIENGETLIMYIDVVDKDSHPGEKSRIIINYFDNNLNIVESISSEGFIADSTILKSISTSQYKNGKLYFTQNLKNKHSDEYYIKFCSFDPISKVFDVYGMYSDYKQFLDYTISYSTTNDESDYIYYGVSYVINGVADFPAKRFLFNTISNQYKAAQKDLELSTILQKDFAYYFKDYIYKYELNTDVSTLFKQTYIHGGFGGEAFGNKVDNSLYVAGRMNGKLGSSFTKYDIEKNKTTIKFFEEYKDNCIIPAITYDELKSINNKLYLPFNSIDPRLCNSLNVVTWDSPPNKYGLFVFDKELNICDTIEYQSDTYRLALMKYTLNDSIIVLTGPVFEQGSIFSNSSFVHFINVNSACPNSSNHQSLSLPEIKIYPVPASNFLSMEIPEHTAFDQLEIINVIGKSVKIIKSDFQNIDIENLTPGAYFIKFSHNNKMVARCKFVKL